MNKKNCDWCRDVFRIRALQKYKKKLICKVCKKKEEKEKGFVNMLDIKKEEQKKRVGMSGMAMDLNKYVKKDVKKIKTNEKETKFPKIPGSKVRKKFNRKFSFFFICFNFF